MLSALATLEDLFHGDTALTATRGISGNRKQTENFKDPSSTSTLSLFK
jgi:hypothetical protein